MKLIDIGAYNGDSALHFIAYPDIDSIDAYDPHNFGKLWQAISEHYPTIKFFPFAVEDFTGLVEFTSRPQGLDLGSTTTKQKDSWGLGDITEVPCVDILEIIPDEKFCLKIDAEGVEYNLLERIRKAGKTELIDRLYVEWHGAKMRDFNFIRQGMLEAEYKGRIQYWI